MHEVQHNQAFFALIGPLGANGQDADSGALTQKQALHGSQNDLCGCRLRHDLMITTTTW